MKLYLKNITKSEMEIAIDYAQGLSESEYDDFKDAVMHYRLGDRFQREQYEKAGEIIAGKKDDIEQLEVALEEAR